ncbi:MAG: ATP-binding protein [Oscillospiraceae bacterium]|jgi:anti-sigma regulatory factor (Ser/Thr protein kinase)|nr:ATP-binding protein [Oscillospiraceae bacterium]MBR4928092.1 ATP-binding protein [Oscillospiraceae bacterium]MBR5980241.1 ATP-binding protein [Oscillospiraceae bacterium]
MSTVLRKEYVVVRDDYAGAGKVSSDVKSTLSSIGIPSPVLRRIAVACYESEINMLIHAYGGDIILEIGDDGVIHMTFSDPGPGIPDIEKAMTPGWSTASDKAREMGFGAGMGLPNIKRVSDEFDITSSPEGTTIQLGFKVT